MARSDRLLAGLNGRPFRDDGPSLIGAAIAAIGWTMLTVVILTAILVACCAPFALTFMFFRKVVGA